ncbi:MAG: hypothetical protein U5N55_03495 [Cypionkella sp.]|nr:hypothetical protein [Cypionkella sp.]
MRRKRAGGNHRPSVMSRAGAAPSVLAGLPPPAGAPPNRLATGTWLAAVGD